MNNPFSLLRLLLRVTRPSRLTDMKAVRDGFWLRPGYEALTFFGFIVTHSQRDADQLNQHYDEVKNHEMIHLRQAQSCHDSWLLFYLLYIWYWLRGLPFNRRYKNAAYRLNPFEMEAYQHMHDLHYLDDKTIHGTNGWRQYARMTMEERRCVKS